MSKGASDGRVFLPPVPPELAGTAEGAEYEYLRWSCSLTFEERLQWLEEAGVVAEAFRTARRLTYDEFLKKSAKEADRD